MLTFSPGRCTRVTRLAAVLLIGGALHCTKMTSVTVAPEQYVSSRRPVQVDLRLTDGSHVSVAGPQIVGDTLTGFIRGTYYETPLSSIATMRALVPAPERTAAIALIVGATVIGGAIYAYTHAGSQLHSECFSIEDDITTC